jgi:hypothetical protein
VALLGDVLHFLQEGATYAREIGRSTENLNANNITVVTATIGSNASIGGGLGVGGGVTALYLQTAVFTVGTLPAPGAVGVGAQTMVSDSLVDVATGIGTVVAPGGGNIVAVRSNGVVWYICG